VAKYVRLEQVTYPDGIREIHYNYAAGVDEIMSRLSSISDGNDNLAEYKETKGTFYFIANYRHSASGIFAIFP
jgi:hypothetical protein